MRKQNEYLYKIYFFGAIFYDYKAIAHLF